MIDLVVASATAYKPAALPSSNNRPSSQKLGRAAPQLRKHVIMSLLSHAQLAARIVTRCRRSLIAVGICAASCCLVAALLADQPVTPSQRGTGQQGRVVSLNDQLRVGLKAFTPSDKAFIDRVVLRVSEGKLPRSMVDSTFLWARTRYLRRPGAHRLRPMVYFRPALVLRARRIGVEI